MSKTALKVILVVVKKDKVSQQTHEERCKNSTKL